MSLTEYNRLTFGGTIVDYCRSEDILATKRQSFQCHCHEIYEIKVLVRPVLAITHVNCVLLLLQIMQSKRE